MRKQIAQRWDEADGGVGGGGSGWLAGWRNRVSLRVGRGIEGEGEGEEGRGEKAAKARWRGTN